MALYIKRTPPAQEEKEMYTANPNINGYYQQQTAAPLSAAQQQQQQFAGPIQSSSRSTPFRQQPPPIGVVGTPYNRYHAPIATDGWMTAGPGGQSAIHHQSPPQQPGAGGTSGGTGSRMDTVVGFMTIALLTLSVGVIAMQAYSNYNSSHSANYDDVDDYFGDADGVMFNIDEWMDGKKADDSSASSGSSGSSATSGSRSGARSTHQAKDVLVNPRELKTPQQKLAFMNFSVRNIVGLEHVKQRCRDYIISSFVAQMEDQYKKQGGGSSTKSEAAVRCSNMIFIGPPGTGKTSFATTFGKLLYQLGLVSKKPEVRHSLTFKGKYVGDTEDKTREACERTCGGVLIVDEAYQLLRGGTVDFGGHALDVLMEYSAPDRKRRPVMIFIGYDDSLRAGLIHHNDGYERRFTDENIFRFNPYNLEELLEIAERNFQKTDPPQALTKEGRAMMRVVFRANLARFTKTNAGLVDVFTARVVEIRRLRVAGNVNILNSEHIMDVTREDIENAARVVFV